MMPLARITVCALFTALLAVFAQIAIPLPFSPVPFTAQMIGLLLAGIILGSKAGLLSVTAYLLLGAAGAPVFSLARGGLHMLIGPTGGYLWGFIPAVFVTGLIFSKTTRFTLPVASIALLPALIIVYCCGALQLTLLMQYSINQTIAIGILPFIPFDLVKIIIAAALGIRIKESLQQNRLGHLFN